MGKYTCLDCKNYCPKKEIVDGYKEECNGMMLVPITKVIESHCDLHPIIYKRWWKKNGNKTSENADEAPKCIELNEHSKALSRIIELTQEILDKIDK